MNSQCDINKVLIGSAAKRIWGSLTANTKLNKIGNL